MPHNWNYLDLATLVDNYRECYLTAQYVATIKHKILVLEYKLVCWSSNEMVLVIT